VYDVLLIELSHFLMERKMLLGLKKRAEHAWRSRAAGPHSTAETDTRSICMGWWSMFSQKEETYQPASWSFSS